MSDQLKDIFDGQQSLPENNHDLATHLNNLAELYRSQGCYSKAEPLYKQAIATAKSFSPQDHPLLATYLNNLALLYQSQGRYSEAEPLYLEACEIDQRSLGSEHPSTVRKYDNLSDFLIEVVREGQESVLSERPLVQKLLTIIKERKELDI
ncbi:MAG: tetratricopeptide repeat protein [Symploca sp. SIO3E6]|nr:tetratricopeptide repeat protein [Caldora sp. SIO3E6]